MTRVFVGAASLLLAAVAASGLAPGADAWGCPTDTPSCRRPSYVDVDTCAGTPYGNGHFSSNTALDVERNNPADPSKGWHLVRRAMEPNRMYPVNDDLKGAPYGNPADFGNPDSSSSWSLDFRGGAGVNHPVGQHYDQILLVTGNNADLYEAKGNDDDYVEGNLRFMVMNKEDIFRLCEVGDVPPCPNYSDSALCILRSHLSATPYSSRNYWRSCGSEDPWISFLDHWDTEVAGSGDRDTMAGYLGTANSHPAQIIKHNGINVYIRKVPADQAGNFFNYYPPGEFVASCAADTDGDGTEDALDNCPSTPNRDQLDTDGDNQGDACDSDIDGDLVDNEVDNCVLTANEDQADTDSDGAGDACDDDPLDDSVCFDSDGDSCDDCSSGQVDPANDGTDTDLDGLCDAGDIDDDDDGWGDANDNCPTVFNPEQVDSDDNGQGDACENADTDGDGVEDNDDCFPANEEWSVSGEVVFLPALDKWATTTCPDEVTCSCGAGASQDGACLILATVDGQDYYEVAAPGGFECVA